MSPTIEEQLERYVTNAILAQEEGPPAPGSLRARQRPDLGGRNALAVALVVFVLGIGVTVALTRGTTTSPAADADLSALSAPRTTVSVPGWKPYTDVLASDLDTTVTVYVRADAPSSFPAAPGQPEVPVYDEPDGTLIGYYYPWVGIVGNETLASGQFDATKARIRRWGCDPLDQSDMTRLKKCLDSMTLGDQIATAKAAIEQQMATMNDAWLSSPRDGVAAEAAAAWPDGAWTWEMFACPPGETTADAWLQVLADQGYRRLQYLESVEPDPGWTPPLDASPNPAESPTGDIYLVHGSFLNGEQVQEGQAHWVVENGNARWITTRCVSP